MLAKGGAGRASGQMLRPGSGDGAVVSPPARARPAPLQTPQESPRSRVELPLRRSSEASRGAACGRRRRGESCLTRSPASSEQATVILVAPRKRWDQGDELADKPCPPAAPASASRGGEARLPRRVEASGPAAGKPDPAGPASASRRRTALEAGALGTLRRQPPGRGVRRHLGRPRPRPGSEARGAAPRSLPASVPAGSALSRRRPGPRRLPATLRSRREGPRGAPRPAASFPTAGGRWSAARRPRGPGQPRAARPLARLRLEDGGSRRQGPGPRAPPPRGAALLSPLRLLPARESLPLPRAASSRV